MDAVTLQSLLAGLEVKKVFSQPVLLKLSLLKSPPSWPGVKRRPRRALLQARRRVFDVNTMLYTFRDPPSGFLKSRT
jgi:hypothetical protein